ncbi:MAG: hypothetical protein V1668_03795 [Patescibacteria group bacterium]
MKFFDIIGKITDRFFIKIGLKNIGLNFGKSNQIGDRNIYQTELKNKTKLDVRKLEISFQNQKAKVIAMYVDGVKDANFQGYWYGWQKAPNSPHGVIWTPLGYSNMIQLPSNTTGFTEVSVWVDRQDNEVGADKNIHASINPNKE